MKLDELKILLALEGKWTVSVNGLEYLALSASDISIEDSTLRFGKYSRKIIDLEWLRSDVVRIRTRAKARTQIDTVTFYPGERLPSGAGIRKRRRGFQVEIGLALKAHFGVRKIERQTLYSDRRHGIGGAYPRFLVGKHAVIAVDPDESSAVINGIMRAAFLWVPLVRRPVAAVVPKGREQTLSARLRSMPQAAASIEWLQWDGKAIRPLEDSGAEPETHVQELVIPNISAEVERICAMAPGAVQAVPHIHGRAISLRLRGLEVARVSDEGISYPLGEPIEQVVQENNVVRLQ